MTKISNLLKEFTTDELESAKDTLGGFKLLDSGCYPTIIKMVYLTQSSGGAMGVAIELDMSQLSQSHRETVWISTRDGANYYTTKEGQKKPLPGFTLINELCLLATENPLSAQEAEEKKVEVYDFETKGKVLKSLPVLVDLVGKKVLAGILKQVVNKQAANSDGKYVPTSETKEQNVLNKVFHIECERTANEIQADGEARFKHLWLDKYNGQLVDKTVPVMEYAKPTNSVNSTPKTTPSKTTPSKTAPKAKKNIFQD